MLSCGSCPVEHHQQLRWVILKGDHSFTEQFSYQLLLGKENEHEAWTLGGHASLHALLQLWRELLRLRDLHLAQLQGKPRLPRAGCRRTCHVGVHSALRFSVNKPGITQTFL